MGAYLVQPKSPLFCTLFLLLWVVSPERDWSPLSPSPFLNPQGPSCLLVASIQPRSGHAASREVPGNSDLLTSDFLFLGLTIILLPRGFPASIWIRIVCSDWKSSSVVLGYCFSHPHPLENLLTKDAKDLTGTFCMLSTCFLTDLRPFPNYPSLHVAQTLLTSEFVPVQI